MPDNSEGVEPAATLAPSADASPAPGRKKGKGKAPGKRSRSDQLPVQRKSASGAAVAPAGESAPESGGDDPFGFHLADRGVVQRVADREPAPSASAETRANDTGLPDQLKTGVESLSGMSMDHVRVHRDSPEPARVQALAYAQGSDIHLGPGQEQHLPHEAWHVVQQAQGRVQPTTQMKGTIAGNDDAGLEAEADTMGAKAMAVGASGDTHAAPSAARTAAPVIQRLKGAPRTAQAGRAVAFTINAEFIEKHVAATKEKAVEVTEARVATGSPPGIAAGTAANHCAPLASWNAAITAATDIVPPSGEWGEDLDVWENESQFVNQLAKVEVTGWEAQGTTGAVAATAKTFKRYVGGTWTVAGATVTGDDYDDGTARVAMDISHLTS